MNIISLVLMLLFQFAVVVPNTPSKEQNSNTDKPGVAKLVYKSTDGGQTWQNISEGLPGDQLEGSFFVNDAGLYLRSGKTIYHNQPNNKASNWDKEMFPDDHSNITASKLGIFAYDYHQGLFRQKINGSNEWSSLYENFPLKGIVDVFETTAGTVFIFCDRGRGIYKSTDKGKTWKNILVGGWVGKFVESNGVLVASSVKGIIRSSDNGDTWTTVISEGGVGIDVARINGGFAAISFNTESNTRRIRVSYDDGKTWQAIDEGLQTQTALNKKWRPIQTSFSVNGGVDSVQHAVGNELPEQAFITTIIQVGEYFYCGHPKGILRSADKGKTWKLMLPSIEGKVFNLYGSGKVIYAVPRNEGC